MYIFYLIYFGILGSVMGSGVITLIDRVKRKESLFTRSHCVSCGHILNPQYLVPILSYLLVKGRCHYCNSKIPQSIIEYEMQFSLIGVIVYMGAMICINMF